MRMRDILYPLVLVIILLTSIGWLATLVLYAVLYVHELAHKYVAEHLGIKVSGIRFTAFGAVTTMERIRSCRDDFMVSLAGPASGVVICALCYVAYTLTGSGLFLGIAGVSAFLNLMNILPMTIADGGRMFEALVAPLRGSHRTGIMVVCNIAAAAVFYVSHVDPIITGVFLVIGLMSASRSASWEKEVSEGIVKANREKQKCEAILAEENKREFPNEFCIEMCRDAIEEADEELRGLFIPRKMNARETAVCAAYIVLVAAGLYVFYLWIGMGFLNYLR